MKLKINLKNLFVQFYFIVILIDLYSYIHLAIAYKYSFLIPFKYNGTLLLVYSYNIKCITSKVVTHN